VSDDHPIPADDGDHHSPAVAVPAVYRGRVHLAGSVAAMIAAPFAIVALLVWLAFNP
jgi:hypothetical protein